MNLEQIVAGGYCSGCGVCNAVDPSIGIKFDKYGRYQAEVGRLPPAAAAPVLRACPFSDEEEDETEIGARLYGSNCEFDDRLGFHGGLYAGHVREGSYRKLGTSGGIITWICCELLKLDLADHVLHVKPANKQVEDKLFAYGISSSEEEVFQGVKSRYYPVEVSGVLETVRTKPGRYVLVGLPCFVKAVRRLMQVEPVFRERIVFTVGLICGHLKSKAFGDSFAWQEGIPPGELEEIDFRVKLPGKGAGNYGVRVVGNGREATRPAREFFGYNWGHNFFRYPACSYCDDVFAETADIVVGDAWLSDYVKDPKGNSVIVVRNGRIKSILEEGISGKRLRLNREPADVIAMSQAGGLRDRRDGLAYRLHLGQQCGRAVPKKRVEPDGKPVPWARRQVYRMRLRMEAASHIHWREAVEKGDFEIFRKKMGRLLLANRFLPYHVAHFVRGKVLGAKLRLGRLLKGLR